MRHTRPILALAAFCCFSLLADEAPPASNAAPDAALRKTAKRDPSPSEAKAATSGAASLVVAKDPVTGTLRQATAAERDRLLGRRPLVSPAPEIVTLPNGTVLMKKRPEDANYAVATRNPDGTLSYACVHGADAAQAAAAPAPAPAPKSADR